METGTTKNIEINAEPIALYQILKFEALVSSGGEAKAAIDDGRVLVNGEVETRRRKKIMSGDIVEFEGERFNVVLK
ncbi:ribosome-associated protein [Paraglaciecola arctica BSs20135]|uniref:Ribosome-associated protein n=1 Tax=Paraglaciecola arctica BSs20135 TaxID=493475 RepID=K6Y029_9ALTE|nr:ribosome-associated protein [Paraglaciecola arctica BSs20135]